MATIFIGKICEIGLYSPSFVSLEFQRGLKYRHSVFLKKSLSVMDDLATLCECGELWSSNSGVYRQVDKDILSTFICMPAVLAALL